ncbi:Uncharacterized protein TCM_006556 [Theobroma cacao]|uniref:Uncharacterized protein n=1 Tax=Theobroma cacao TaxID=3641 RepID=A0A061DXZ3_THECC|nr:Uncharacterized protein TCM_006556 [Theobroma cacao]
MQELGICLLGRDNLSITNPMENITQKEKHPTFGRCDLNGRYGGDPYGHSTRKNLARSILLHMYYLIIN